MKVLNPATAKEKVTLTLDRPRILDYERRGWRAY